MELRVKRLTKEAVLPKRATADSAGLDLCACINEPLTFAPNETHVVPTGLAFAIPDGYVGLVFARSGLATKHGIAPVNAVGVIDSDYRGELLVALRNCFDTAYTIQSGERVAQLVLTPVLLCQPVEADDLTPTERGEGGFGSTGKD